MECTHCKHTFSNKSALTRHQNKANYCMKIQIENSLVICEYCELEFIQDNLKNHLLTCVEKRIYDIVSDKDKIIADKNLVIKEIEEKYEAKITELQDKIFDIMKNNSNSIEQPKDMILTLNSTPIISRKEDGYINLTSICKAGKKEFNDWKSNKKTEAFLKVLSSTAGIPGVELINYISGGNGKRHSWGHPQVAINIAQWISPEFDVQVSKWIYQLAVTGKVELKNEKTTKEIDSISYEKRVSLDIQPYLCKDVLYFFEFIPEFEDQPEIKELHNENIHYFEFGVTSNIQQRQSGYSLGHRLDNAFVYDTGFKVSLAEKYVKKLVLDFNLKLNYKNKSECMRCTYSELKNIYTLMTDHNFTSKEHGTNDEQNETNTNTNFEIEKLKINAEIEKERINSELKLELEKLKLVNKQEMITNMMNNKSLSFEQFKECFQMC